MFCGYWDIVFITNVSLVCVVVDTVSDELHQPQDLNVSWTSHFSVTAQWSKPTGLDTGCKGMYSVTLYSTKCPPEEKSYIRKWLTKELSYTWHLNQTTDAKCVVISQDCGNKTYSQQVYKDIPQPQDLVRDFSCVYYAVQKMNCTWNLVSPASDLQFFYSDKKNSLNPCIVYIGNGSTRTGCHLYGEEFLSIDWLYIVFNATHDALPIQNVFLRNPRESVTSQPPKFNITREGDNLVFQSSRPNFKEDCWFYNFNISKCSEEDQVHKGEKDSNWSVRVQYDEACKYTVRVQAKFRSICGNGASDWSETKEYGGNNDPNWLLKAFLIIIPATLSCCLIAALILFRRHKEEILPKVPEPSLLFRDVFNDQEEGKMTKDLHVGQLYVPTEELVETKLHLEPKATLLHLEE